MIFTDESVATPIMWFLLHLVLIKLYSSLINFDLVLLCVCLTLFSVFVIGLIYFVLFCFALHGCVLFRFVWLLLLCFVLLCVVACVHCFALFGFTMCFSTIMMLSDLVFETVALADSVLAIVNLACCVIAISL